MHRDRHVRVMYAQSNSSQVNGLIYTAAVQTLQRPLLPGDSIEIKIYIANPALSMVVWVLACKASPRQGEKITLLYMITIVELNFMHITENVRHCIQ